MQPNATLDALRKRAAWRPNHCPVCGSTWRQRSRADALICGKVKCRAEYVRLWREDNPQVSHPWMRTIVSFQQPGRGVELGLECGHVKLTDRVRPGQRTVRCMVCRKEILAKARKRFAKRKSSRGALQL